MKDCIVAIATSTATNSGINIIRMSGEGSKDIAKKIFFNKNAKEEDFLPNKMYLGTIKAKNFSEQAFCVFFKAPKSYTGENIIEFHCHGGKGIAYAIFMLCVEKGARIAQNGEFTKRAFLNGKLNLSQAEGVQEMINAQTQIQMRHAYKMLSGEVSGGINNFERRLLKIIANLEVKLDYPEEIEDDYDISNKEELKQILGEIDELLENCKYSKIINKGINIAIVGQPNAGKSSLLNGLLMEERAIVTAIEGTTRDVLSESIEVDGIKINLLDTAGIRESENEIEKIGIDKTKQTIKYADTVIFVMDLSKPISPEEKQIEILVENKKTIRVGNKKDIKKYERENCIEIKSNPPRDIEALKKELMKTIGKDKIESSNIITNERHIECLKEAKENLSKALRGFDFLPAECSLFDIREGYSSLARIIGKDINEEIVDQIFSSFCVGK